MKHEGCQRYSVCRRLAPEIPISPFEKACDATPTQPQLAKPFTLTLETFPSLVKEIDKLTLTRVGIGIRETRGNPSYSSCQLSLRHLLQHSVIY